METKVLFQQALLAEAAYADLEGVSTSRQLKTALIANKFSIIQAEDFVSHWKVISHQPDTASGFSMDSCPLPPPCQRKSYK